MNEQQKAIAEIVAAKQSFFDGYKIIEKPDFIERLADYFTQEDQHKDCVDSAQYPCHGIKFDREAWVAACYKERE